VLAETEAIDKRMQKFSVRLDAEGRLAGRRLPAARQIRDQDAAMAGERRPPAVKVLERADEAMSE
jgi:hypothetical protein